MFRVEGCVQALGHCLVITITAGRTDNDRHSFELLFEVELVSANTKHGRRTHDPRATCTIRDLVGGICLFLLTKQSHSLSLYIGLAIEVRIHSRTHRL